MKLNPFFEKLLISVIKHEMFQCLIFKNEMIKIDLIPFFIHIKFFVSVYIHMYIYIRKNLISFLPKEKLQRFGNKQIN